MHAKFFRQLPATLHRYVDAFLNSSDSADLARTSSDFHSLSKKPPLTMEQRKSLNKFLGHVVHGEREQMQEMLRQNNQLLLQRDTITDYSGRTFDSISGFEYALWALDKHQWDDMLACLPRDETAHLTEYGRKVVQELMVQYEQIKTKGVSYRLNNMIEKESHYDFSIINVLQEQVNAQNAPRDKNWDAIDQHWIHLVGGVQRLAPVHVVDEYRSGIRFSPVPSFVSRPQPENNVRQFHNMELQKWEPWFGGDSKLGIDFAMYKGHWPSGVCVYGAVRFAGADLDLEAVQELCKRRKLDFNELKVQLESMMNVEEHPCSERVMTPI